MARHGAEDAPCVFVARSSKCIRRNHATIAHISKAHPVNA